MYQASFEVLRALQWPDRDVSVCCHGGVHAFGLKLLHEGNQ